jgi:hypothetical protein
MKSRSLTNKRLSTLKGHGGDSSHGGFNHNQGNFTHIQPYGPDDFVSPLPTGDSTRSRGGYDATYENETRAYGYEEGGTIDSSDRQAFQTLDYPVLANDVHPPAATPPSLDMFSPTQYQGIQDRRAENAAIPTPSLQYSSPPQLDVDGFPVVSEIDDFTTSFHRAIEGMSPPTPQPTGQMPNLASRDLTSAQNAPPTTTTYPGIGANMAGGIGASLVAGTKNLAREASQARGGAQASSYSPIGAFPEDTPPTTFPYLDDSDYDDDDFEYEEGAEMKEMGMAQTVSYNKTSPHLRSYTSHQNLEEHADPPNFDPTYSHPENFSFKAEDVGSPTAPPAYKDPYVRDEGWVPVELRPNREQVEMLSEETRRYQLVDRPPTAAPVLRSSGMRGAGRKNQEMKSKDVSKGELEE